jgi:hypothetical protein
MIASISVRVDGAVPGARLVVDGIAGGSATSGEIREVSLDPGAHRLELHSENGTVLARSELDVGPGDHRSIALRGPAPDALAAAIDRAPLAHDSAAQPRQGGDAEAWMWFGIGSCAVAVIMTAALIGVVAAGGGSGGGVDPIEIRGR